MTGDSFRRLCAIALASPLVLAAFEAQAVRSDLSVGSGGSNTNHTELTAAPYTLDVGGTVAAVQFATTPLCDGLACSIDGPAVSATLVAGNGSKEAQVTARYSFNVLGGADPVPILLSGLYAVVNPLELPDGLGGTVASAAVGVTDSVGTVAYSFQSLCYNYTYYLNESGPPKNCGSGTFSGSFFAATGSTLSVVLSAFAGRIFSDAAPGAASAYIDPFFQIDPIWAESHSGYSLQFEAGVGNGAPDATSPVPEPETVVLMAAGLAVLLRRRHLVGARARS
jgi:PEP-CTERM motif